MKVNLCRVPFFFWNNLYIDSENSLSGGDRLAFFTRPSFWVSPFLDLTCSAGRRFHITSIFHVVYQNDILKMANLTSRKGLSTFMHSQYNLSLNNLMFTAYL